MSCAALQLVSKPALPRARSANVPYGEPNTGDYLDYDTAIKLFERLQEEGSRNAPPPPLAPQQGR